MLLIGVDDAGRGPIMGPMILAGVLMAPEQEKTAKEAGAKDSKLLTHPQRLALARIIEKNCIKSKVVMAFPEEIDSAVNAGKSGNLNTLEAKKMAEVINALNPKNEKVKVIVDCPSINIPVWRAKLISFITHPENLEIKCEHKADFNYPVVSSASILAKVAREEEVEKIKKQYGNTGSGYPSDPTTKEFLKANGKRLADSGIFRKSWATWKALFPEPKQKTLF
ncbi:MAG: ribonuclease HII [archaeon]|nr:ribonuclease HII [archaeon]